MCGEAENNDEENLWGINVQPLKILHKVIAGKHIVVGFGLALQLCRKNGAFQIHLVPLHGTIWAWHRWGWITESQKYWN